MLVKLIVVLLALAALANVEAAKDNNNGRGTPTPPGHAKSNEKTPKPKPTKPPPATKAAPKAAPAAKGAPAAAKAAPPPQKGKSNCGVCTGAGKDCTPTSVDKNVEFCAKVTGTVDDPKNTPSSFFSILQFAGLGDVKTMMTQHKGEVVTIRKGAPPSLIALAGQKYNDEGCSDFPLLLGLKDATACLCKGDCP